MTSWAASAPVAWPFVGRDELVALLARMYAAPTCRGVVIEGPAGIGKTRLADEFIHGLGGVTTLRCVGTVAGQTVPYSAIAHLIPGDLSQQGAEDPRLVLEAVRNGLTGKRTVLMADDVALLDESSLALLMHLLALDQVFLVGTVRSDHTVPPGLDSLIRSFDLPRVGVVALTEREVAAATEAVVGAPVEPTSAARLAQRTGGNPLYLRELLLQTVASDAIEIMPSGEARIDIDVSSVPRLVEMVRARLDAVPDELMPLLHMIAVAEPLLIGDLETAGMLQHATALEQRGWIRADPRGNTVEIRVAHPLHGEVLRSTMGVLEFRRQMAAAAELVGRRAVPERDDSLRRAMWELDAGLEPSPKVLLEGAHRARAAVDLASTLRLAEAAFRLQPSGEAQLLWLETLFLLGNFEEAERVGSLPAPPDVQLQTIVAMLMLRMDNVVWGLGDPERALALVESYRPALVPYGLDFLLTIPEAFIRSVDGQTARAMELLGDEHADPVLFLLSSLARCTALLGRGRYAEVERVCNRGLELLAAMPDPRASMDPLFFRLNLGMARNLGGRFDQVYDELSAAYAGVVEEHHAFLRCFVCMVTGHAALSQGQLVKADQWLAETELATRRITQPVARRIAISGRASAAGQRGDVAASAVWLTQLDELQPDLDFMLVETASGRAWALHCLGRPGEARDCIRSVVEWAITADEPVAALMGLTEACRLGDGKWAADQIERVAGADEIEGPLAAAQRSFVRAHGGRLGGPFLAAATEFAALGAHVLAAEAASMAATAFGREGQRREASSARALMTAELSECDPVATPALQSVPTSTPLSSRELEVARLAAQGHSSKVIAERLYLSPRTVENHLQRVYTKLGVNGRDDLERVL